MIHIDCRYNYESSQSWTQFSLPNYPKSPTGESINNSKRDCCSWKRRASICATSRLYKGIPTVGGTEYLKKRAVRIVGERMSSSRKVGTIKIEICLRCKMCNLALRVGEEFHKKCVHGDRVHDDCKSNELSEWSSGVAVSCIACYVNNLWDSLGKHVGALDCRLAAEDWMQRTVLWPGQFIHFSNQHPGHYFTLTYSPFHGSR